MLSRLTNENGYWEWQIHPLVQVWAALVILSLVLSLYGYHGRSKLSDKCFTVGRWGLALTLGTGAGYCFWSTFV